MAIKQDETETQAMWGTLVASLETLRAGDIEGSLAYWADDGTVRLIGVQPIDPGTYMGKEQVRAWLSGLYNDHFVIEEELAAIEGNTVTVSARTWSDTTRRLGVAPLEATEVFVLADGKIKSLVWTMTPRSLERLLAAIPRA